MKNPIQLSDHFTFGRLLRFTLPSIASMIFASIYGIVDGFFDDEQVSLIRPNTRVSLHSLLLD